MNHQSPPQFGVYIAQGNKWGHIPEDLAQIVPRPMLFQAACEASQLLYWEEDMAKGSPPASITCIPSATLALLAYAYSAGVYNSADALSLANADEIISADVGLRPTPSPARLRRFRNHHSELVKRCLEHVLHQAESAYILGGRTVNSHVGLAECPQRKQSGAWGHCLIRWEAERRFRLAVDSDEFERGDAIHFAE